MNSEKATSANQETGSAPRIFNGFSIESILAKPDRIMASKPGHQQTPAMLAMHMRLSETSSDLVNGHHQQDYGPICKDLSNHHDPSRNLFNVVTADHHQLQHRHANELRIACTSTAPDSSCVDDPTGEAMGSEDGDNGSEESGCKCAKQYDRKIDQLLSVLHTGSSL